MAIPNSHSPPKLGQSIETLNLLKWGFYHLPKTDVLSWTLWLAPQNLFLLSHWIPLMKLEELTLTPVLYLIGPRVFQLPFAINSGMDKWPKSDQLCRSNCMEVSGKVHSNQWESINLSFKQDVFVAQLILTATLQSWGGLALVWSQQRGWQSRKMKRNWSLMA